MKVLLTGGRDFSDRKSLFDALDQLHSRTAITRIIHGAAQGADQLGAQWAIANAVEIASKPADWKRYGRRAGMVRNKEMLDLQPDFVVACPGGSGTQNMIALSEKAGITIIRVKPRSGISIGFTGTARGMTKDQRECVREALQSFKKVLTVHHGDCIGADAEFHDISRALNLAVHVHPPKRDKKRAFCTDAEEVLPEKDSLKRNHDIVDACSVLIAAPNTDQEKLRSGTWATVRYARKFSKKIFILLPSGEIIVEN